MSAVLRTIGKRWLVVAAIAGVALSGTVAFLAGPAVPASQPVGTTAAVQVGLLDEAEQFLIRDCMSAAGFEYWPTTDSGPTVDQRFPYVIDDVTWASRHGHGSDLEAQRAQARTVDPNQRYVLALRPDRRAAYSAALDGAGPDGPGVVVTLPGGAVEGESSQGCVATAEQRLYGDFPAWFRASTVVRALPRIWQVQVVDDPAFAAATRQWADCMRRRGYDYASPAAARAALAESGTRRTEVATAVAEAACANTTDLAAVARRLDAHYSAIIRARYRAAVTAQTRMRSAAMERALTIVHNG